VKTQVSRGPFIEKAPVCVKCWKRPKVKGQKRWHSYCRECRAEYNRQRREGRSEMILTPQEREIILALRALPKGRHHAS
jgi:tRNA(Ile2) C34 agmatinyltransferase TiaS